MANKWVKHNLFHTSFSIFLLILFMMVASPGHAVIKNPSVAAEIAQKGQLRTIKTHSYTQKAEKMNEYIQELF